MSRVLSSIGIGSATVDTILPETDLSPGTTIEASVELEGGESDQRIDGISFVLLTNGVSGDTELDSFEISDEFTLEAGTTQTMTTTVTIPRWTPLTRDGQHVWLKTRLDIDWAVDPTDEDTIEVVPGPHVSALFDAIDELGFSATTAELEPSPWLDRQPFVQEFEFVPTTETYGEEIDSLTVACVPRADDLRVFIEIDEREEAEAFADIDYDEQEISVVFDTTNVDMIRRQLRNAIDQYTHT